MKRCLAAFAALPLCAQLALTVREGSTERPVTGAHDFGLATPGEVREARFRIRNGGAAPVTVNLLTVSGTGFSLAAVIPLPYVLAPASAADIAVRFAPAQAGAYNGLLRINELPIELRGRAYAAAALERETAAGWAPLAPPAEIDLGSTERGQASRTQFRLANRTPAPLEAGPVAVAGEGFHLEPAWPAVRTLAPGESGLFSLVAAADRAGTYEGMLRLDTREFKLKLAVRELPSPRPTLLVPDELENGKQEKIALRLEGPAPAALDGVLSLKFEPAPGWPHDDSGLGLGSGLARTASFQIPAGASRAEFAGAAELLLQTGTTAGALVLTGKVGEHTVELRRVLAPQAVGLDAADALRSTQQVDVRLRGFDNTRTAGRLRFMFFLRGGTPLAQGPVEVDIASRFLSFFKEQAGAGGAFALNASFPVSGTAAELEAVEVEIFNQAGARKSARLALR